jgi:YbbR domain-containing protein
MPQGTQACGYVISGIDVQPAAVMVHGPIDNVSKMDTVSVDPVNISGLTASTTVTRRIVTGTTVVFAEPSTVRVTVNMSQVFSCAAPSPAAAVLPASPSPSGAPSPAPP